MKLYLYLIALWLLSASMSAGQVSTPRRTWWLGAKIGGQTSRYIFVPTVRQQTHLGEQVSLAVRWDIEEHASVQLELNHVRTGWKERFDNLDMKYRRDINYLEAPMLTHLYLGKGVLRVFVNAGFVFGYYLGERAQKSDNIDYLRYSMPVARKLYWGLCGGPGVSLALGKRHRLELESRLTYGLGDIWANKRADPYVQSNQQRLGLTLNYFFQLSQR